MHLYEKGEIDGIVGSWNKHKDIDKPYLGLFDSNVVYFNLRYTDAIKRISFIFQNRTHIPNCDSTSIKIINRYFVSDISEYRRIYI